MCVSVSPVRVRPRDFFIIRGNETWAGGGVRRGRYFFLRSCRGNWRFLVLDNCDVYLCLRRVCDRVAFSLSELCFCGRSNACRGTMNYSISRIYPGFGHSKLKTKSVFNVLPGFFFPHGFGMS